MAFGTATVSTNKNAAIQSGRMVGGTPTQTELKYVAGGVGATSAARTAAVGDTVLSSELAEGRVAGALSQSTQTVTNDTLNIVATVTATGSRSVDEAAVFDAVSSGNMGLSATFPVVSLLVGDSIQFTWKHKYVPG